MIAYFPDSIIIPGYVVSWMKERETLHMNVR